MLLGLFLAFHALMPSAHALDVTYLTQTGALNLKSWSNADLKGIASHGGSISAQKLIFDDSADKLDLNDRANVDQVILYGDTQTARVPRFMVWRGYLKLHLGKDGELSASGDANRLLVPGSIFNVSKIKKIELSRASLQFPDAELHLRTNPAASRGEKLFNQSCLACHGLATAPKLKVDAISDAQLDEFATKHKGFSLTLDARAHRGLIAFRDALVKEHSEVKSQK